MKSFASSVGNKYVRPFFRGLPLIRSLMDSSPKHRKDSLSEFIVIFVFSVFPLLATAVGMMANSPTHRPFSGVMWDLISDGELILYSASFLSGTLYLVLSEQSGQAKFKERLPQGLLVVGVMITSYFVFLFNKFDIWKNKEMLVDISEVLFYISLFLLYCSLVFGRGISPMSLRDQEDESVAGFNAYMSDREV